MKKKKNFDSSYYTKERDGGGGIIDQIFLEGVPLVDIDHLGL